MADLEGRCAIVTGGARGIGRAVCELLAERGCALVVNHNSSQAAAEALVGEVNAAGGRAVAVAGLDRRPGDRPEAGRDRARALRQPRRPREQRRHHPRRDRAQDDRRGLDGRRRHNLTGTHRVTRAVIEPMCRRRVRPDRDRLELRRRARQLRPGQLRRRQGRPDRAGRRRWRSSSPATASRPTASAPASPRPTCSRASPRRSARRLLARVPLGRFASAAGDRAGGRLRARRGRLHDRHVPRHQRRAVHVSGPLRIGSRAERTFHVDGRDDRGVRGRVGRPQPGAPRRRLRRGRRRSAAASPTACSPRAFFSALLANDLPGPGTIYLGQRLRFTAPVRPGDDVRCEVEVTALDAARRRATLATRAWVGDTLVVDGEATV